MRHRKSFSQLGRPASHRRAMLANLVTQLFMHKKIRTTTAKAKALRPLAERLITFAKQGTLHARRLVLRIVRDQQVVRELFADIAPVYATRNGGYTRIVKLGRRSGDGAELAYIELVDFESVRKEKKEKKEKKKTVRETPAEKKAEEQNETEE